MPDFIRKSPTTTGEINSVSGVYSSKCHGGERTILEGQPFPRCGYCNADTVWIFKRPIEARSSGAWRKNIRFGPKA